MVKAAVDCDPVAGEVLGFWFEHGIEDPISARRSLDVWFQTNPAYDDQLRTRFTASVARAYAGEFEHWRDSGEQLLALLLLTDQIPRNIYRRRPQAFQADVYAQQLASDAIARGLHRAVPFYARLFFYMPFEHAEDLALQDRCVAGYREMHAEAPPEWHELTATLVEAGETHREVIREFGRFPHRNAILGRESSAAELAWCAEHTTAWGQGPAVTAAD